MSKRKPKQRVLHLVNVTKTYQIRHQKPTFFDTLPFLKKRHEFQALKDVNLEISQEERVGIIGLNGSGKTTLLKVMSGITQPTVGSVETVGTLVSLIDLEAGFHPDLTGEENIFLNGLLIGMSKAEITRKLASIIKFADIDEFISAPFYTYSQGMKMRLAFAIGIHADPDILIMDEGIVAGDFLFQKKASVKMHQLFKKKKTIIVVTHWLEYLQANCQRIIWMREGHIFKDGGIEVIAAYRKYMAQQKRRTSRRA